MPALRAVLLGLLFTTAAAQQICEDTTILDFGNANFPSRHTLSRPGTSYRIGDVGAYQGEHLDMLISVKSGQVLSTSTDASSGFLQLRVPQHGADLDFKILKAGTNEPVVLPNVRFSVLDIDGCRNTHCTRHPWGVPNHGRERLTVCTPHDHVLSTNSMLDVGTDHGCKMYTATVGGMTDNQPASDGTLGEVQKALAAELIFSGRSEWEMSYKVMEGNNRYRTMLITTDSKIQECKDTCNSYACAGDGLRLKANPDQIVCDAECSDALCCEPAPTPKPTPEPTPAPTPAPCKDESGYCDAICTGVSQSGSCKSDCLNNFDAVKGVLEEYCREGLCDEAEATSLLQQMRQGSSLQARAKDHATKASSEVAQSPCKKECDYCYDLCHALGIGPTEGLKCELTCKVHFQERVQGTFDTFCSGGICPGVAMLEQQQSPVAKGPQQADDGEEASMLQTRVDL